MVVMSWTFPQCPIHVLSLTMSQQGAVTDRSLASCTNVLMLLGTSQSWGPLDNLENARLLLRKGKYRLRCQSTRGLKVQGTRCHVSLQVVDAAGRTQASARPSQVLSSPASLGPPSSGTQSGSPCRVHKRKPDCPPVTTWTIAVGCLDECHVPRLP